MPIICEKVIPDSIVYSDYWRRYNSLDVSEFKHYRINHSKLFADKYNHINGIENFWNQAKSYLRKFNGVPKENFPLFLKEYEWRFNNPNPKSQLAQLNQSVKNCLSSYLVQPLVLFIIAYLALMYTSQKRPFFETSAGSWRFPFYKATQHHGRKPADEGIPESSFLC